MDHYLSEFSGLHVQVLSVGCDPGLLAHTPSSVDIWVLYPKREQNLEISFPE
jgi:hypothetical protein